MAILKILSRHSPSIDSLVRYILRYVTEEEKTGTTQVYTSNLRSGDIPGYVREFLENEALRKRSRIDNVHIYHEIVSFSSVKDSATMTPAMIDDLAREYMRLRGGTGVMLGAPHYDRDHVHIHFCVSALQYRTGTSFGLNKAQLRELKDSFQEYHRQRYPELTESFPRHGRGGPQLSHGRWNARRREEVLETVRQCFGRAETQGEFLESLREEGLHHYERGGSPAGIEHGGAKFRFSRLLGKGLFEALPVDRTADEQALSEIRSIRERMSARDLIDRDASDFEDRAR